MFECPVCHKEFENQHGLKSHWGWYCKKTSSDVEIYSYLIPKDTDYNELSRSARRYLLLKEANFACSQCGFSKTRDNGKTILEIDHIDGNHKNNSKENLQVLCPNCHALTPNFRNWGRKGGEKSSSRFRKGNKGFQEQVEERKKFKDILKKENEEYEKFFIETVLKTYENDSINYRKFGWVTELTEELSKNEKFNMNIFSRKTIGVKMKKLMSEFYEKNCFKVYRKNL